MINVKHKNKQGHSPQCLSKHSIVKTGQEIVINVLISICQIYV